MVDIMPLNLNAPRMPASRIWRAILAVTLAAGFILPFSRPGLAQDFIQAKAPYPASPVITGISWDTNSRTRNANGSDLFPLTWADDGNLYTAWGDGWGFSRSGTKRSLGVSRISGTAGSYQATDLWSGVGKAHAILSVGGTLYMVITEQGAWMRGKLAWSTDHGTTWTQAAGWTFAEPGGVFAAPAFLQFGKDYAGARDGYVYGYSEKVRGQIQPDLVMFRVPKVRLKERNAYEFFGGLDGSGNPRWTSDIHAMKPVFTDPNGVGWGMQASYNTGLKRYLLTVRHNDSGGWGIFDAPEPWGPWTTVAYYDNWIDSKMKFTFAFSPKWTSADGLSTWMAFSGLEEYDSFNLIKGTFIKKSPTPVPPLCSGNCTLLPILKTP